MHMPVLLEIIEFTKTSLTYHKQMHVVYYAQAYGVQRQFAA
jgi:hypothetical protein